MTIWTVALLGLLVPLLGAVTADDIAMGTTPPQGAETIVRSSLAVRTLAPLGGAAEAAPSAPWTGGPAGRYTSFVS